MKERKDRCECVVRFRGGVLQATDSFMVEEVSGSRRSPIEENRESKLRILRRSICNVTCREDGVRLWVRVWGGE